ncbi:hypothetical protein CC79DRAFT_909794 [Sarocladium strictum]
MADVRSLLRQQREARRIDHPHAAYSDAGKLLCTLCREPVKTEALWEGHTQSATHRQNVQQARAAALSQSKDADIAAKGLQQTDADSHEENGSFGNESTVASHPKRKHSRDEDGDEPMDESVRRKRSRPDIVGTPNRSDSDKETRPHRSNSDALTPPTLARRASTTPSQGVELQIPSRPATPSHRDGSSASTPGTVASGAAANGQQTTRLATGLSAMATGSEIDGPSAKEVDESEWAAFEADIAATSVPYDEDATISAPAMTAEEAAAAAAKADDEADASKRKSKADVDLEDEKEEATRALEDEFEEMEELEARVQRLREKREDIRRKRSESQGQATAAVPTKLNGVGKENLQETIAETAAVESDEDEEEDDEDEDDWDSFRFRGR